MKPESTWLGIGVKSGGQLLFGGVESMSGIYYNLGNPNMQRSFSMTSSRWGLGLGGGGGLFVSFYFKTNELYWLNGRTIEDWGVNVSLGKKWVEIAKALYAMNFFRNIKIARAMLSIVSNLEELRNAAHYVYNAADIDPKEEHPTVAFDIPGSGIGLELSAFKTKGTMYID